MSTWDDLRGWLDQRDDAHAAAVTAADHAGPQVQAALKALALKCGSN